MDLNTIDFPVVLTSLVELVTSLGGAAVLIARSKFTGAFGVIAEILTDTAALLTAIVEAQQDDKITPEEWKAISDKAFEIKGHGEALVKLFGK